MNVIRLIASRLITSIPIFTNRAMRTSYGKRPIINDGCPGRKEWLRAGEPATQKKRETTNGHECTRMKIDYSCLFVLIRGFPLLLITAAHALSAFVVNPALLALSSEQRCAKQVLVNHPDADECDDLGDDAHRHQHRIYVIGRLH